MKEEEECTTVVLEYLIHSNHYEAARELEMDTGISVFGDLGEELNFMRDLVLDGEWQHVEQCMSMNQFKSIDAAFVVFLARKQKFLELVDADPPVSSKVLRYVFNMLRDMGVATAQEINQLKFCLSQLSVSSQYPWWTKMKGRYFCFHDMLNDGGLWAFASRNYNVNDCMIKSTKTPKLFRYMYGQEVHDAVQKPSYTRPARNRRNTQRKNGPDFGDGPIDFAKSYTFTTGNEKTPTKAKYPSIAFDVMLDGRLDENIDKASVPENIKTQGMPENENFENQAEDFESSQFLGRSREVDLSYSAKHEFDDFEEPARPANTVTTTTTFDDPNPSSIKTEILTDQLRYLTGQIHVLRDQLESGNRRQGLENSGKQTMMEDSMKDEIADLKAQLEAMRTMVSTSNGVPKEKSSQPASIQPPVKESSPAATSNGTNAPEDFVGSTGDEFIPAGGDFSMPDAPPTNRGDHAAKQHDESKAREIEQANIKQGAVRNLELERREIELSKPRNEPPVKQPPAPTEKSNAPESGTAVKSKLPLPKVKPAKDGKSSARQHAEPYPRDFTTLSSTREASTWIHQFHPSVCLYESAQPIRSVTFDELGTQLAIGTNAKSIAISSFPNDMTTLGEVSPLLAEVSYVQTPTTKNEYAKFEYENGQAPPQLRLRSTLHEEKNVHLGSIYCLDWTTFDAQNSILASGSNDKLIKIWKVRNNSNKLEGIASFREHHGTVRALKFFINRSGDIKLASVASGSSGNIVVSDIATCGCDQKITGHDAPIFDVDVSLDHHLVTASEDGTIKLWDSREDHFHSKASITLERRVFSKIHAVRCSPVSEYLLCSGHDDGSCVVWDYRKPDPIVEALHHRDDVRSVDFSPDGRWIVTGSFDGTVGIVDTDAFTQNTVATFRGHSDKILSAKWHPQLPYFVTSSSDNTVKAWSFARKQKT